MATDDISLRVEMGRLEIEPNKIVKNVKEENPFLNPLLRKGYTFKSSAHNSKCTCLWQKKKNNSISKKKHKLLKEPILKISSPPFKKHNSRSEYHLFNKNLLEFESPEKLNCDPLCLLVDNCNQLSISSDKGKSCIKIKKKVSECANWWKSEDFNERQSIESSERNSTGSCSQQALNPPCDITIDELASYFETLVHIPKKMSSMAEMMYI